MPAWLAGRLGGSPWMAARWAPALGPVSADPSGLEAGLAGRGTGPSSLVACMPTVEPARLVVGPVCQQKQPETVENTAPQQHKTFLHLNLLQP
ncbi:hypothetical protein QYE76_047143 [Lolium multiflorum]|uniref:Uncharacterized protein n=1 Tax=Lolium multiflorum TaxID=4521 RepID=A0AAD8WZB3_LOLMU|nr:hypothetical protein QYE76_047143 [Lolium multiflorum]